MKAGDRRDALVSICELEKSVRPASAALLVSRDADRAGISKWQSESVKLLIGDVSGDISYIDSHGGTCS